MSGIWPGDTRCVVMLGFDIDGVSSAINRDPDSANLPSLMSMREYGPSVGDAPDPRPPRPPRYTGQLLHSQATSPRLMRTSCETYTVEATKSATTDTCTSRPPP